MSNQELLTQKRTSPNSVYACSYPGCGRAFRTKFSCKRHTLTHQTEKKFSCELCKKKFTLSQHLREHMYRHTNKKPYVCGVAGCEERFRHASELSLHRRTHPEYKLRKHTMASVPRKLSTDVEPNKESGSPTNQFKEPESNVSFELKGCPNKCIGLNFQSQGVSLVTNPMPGAGMIFPALPYVQPSLNMEQSIRTAGAVSVSIPPETLGVGLCYLQFLSKLPSPPQKVSVRPTLPRPLNYPFVN